MSLKGHVLLHDYDASAFGVEALLSLSSNHMKRPSTARNEKVRPAKRKKVGGKALSSKSLRAGEGVCAGNPGNNSMNLANAANTAKSSNATYAATHINDANAKNVRNTVSSPTTKPSRDLSKSKKLTKSTKTRKRSKSAKRMSNTSIRGSSANIQNYAAKLPETKSPGISNVTQSQGTQRQGHTTALRSYKRKKEAIIELIDQCPNQSKLFFDLARHYGHPFMLMVNEPNVSKNNANKKQTNGITNDNESDTKKVEGQQTPPPTPQDSETPAKSSPSVESSEVFAAKSESYAPMSERLLLRGLRQVIMMNSKGNPSALVGKLLKELRVPLSLNSITLSSLKTFFDSIKAGRGLEPVRQAKQTLLTVLFAHKELTPKILCKEIGIAPYSQSIKNLFSGAIERAAHNSEVMRLKGSLRDRAKKGMTFRYFDPPAKRSDCMESAVTKHAVKFYYTCCAHLSKRKATTLTEESDQPHTQPRSETEEDKDIFILNCTLEEVRQKWINLAKKDKAEGGLGKGPCYTVSRSWFGKQRPTNVQLNPDFNGSRTWIRQARKQRQMKTRNKQKQKKIVVVKKANVVSDSGPLSDPSLSSAPQVGVMATSGAASGTTTSGAAPAAS